jgi:sugar diacid utilization regulator
MLNIIKNLLPAFETEPTHLEQSGTLYDLTGYLEVRPGICIGPVSVRTLYVICDKTYLPLLELIPDMCILYITSDRNDPLFSDGNHPPCTILTVESNDPERIIEKLQDFFRKANGLGHWSDTMLSILFFEGGIPAIVEHAYTLFLNPIYLLNPDYRLTAYAPENTQDLDPIGTEIVQNGGFSQKEFSIMNRNHALREMIDSRIPVIVNIKESPYRMIVSRIDPEQDLGHFVIVEKNRSFDDLDMKFATVLQLSINQQMKKDQFIRSTRKQNEAYHHEFFLKDVLDGKISIGTRYQEYSELIREDFTGELMCLVIELARSSSLVNAVHLRTLFEVKYSNANSVMYNNTIVVVFCFPPNRSLHQEAIRDFESTCKEYGIYAGLSSPFDNILELKAYYDQAMLAISLGYAESLSPTLFLYQDYYLKHLAKVFKDHESVEAFLDPSMKKLFQYDKSHGTELSKALYYYLVYERNAAEAARALFIHRNTLLYHLKKIDSIVSIHYDNYLERQRIMISYEMITGIIPETPASAPEQIVKKRPTSQQNPALDPISEKILHMLREDPGISQRKIAASVGTTHAAIRYHMDQLQKSGIITRVGSARSGQWVMSQGDGSSDSFFSQNESEEPSP